MRSFSHGHVVRRADVDVVGVEHVVLDLAGDGLGLGDLLGLEALALEHVLEVHVAAEVELVGVVEGQAAVLEEPGEDAVHDGRADLALDVVADDRHAGVAELAGPLGVGGDEDGDGVDEGHAGVEAGLGVVALGLLGADRQVGDQDVGLGVAQRLGDVDRLGRRLLDQSRGSTCPSPSKRRAPLDRHAELADLGEADGVVQAGVDRLAQVGADLGLVDVEGGHGHEVADVVAAELDVHQARDDVVGVGVAVVGDALDERAGAVADAGDGESDGAGHGLSPSVSVLRVVRHGRRIGCRRVARVGAFGRDEAVEPADVAGDAVGRVLDDRAGVDVEVGAGRLGLAQALDQLGPAALEEGEPGLGREVPGEGQAQPEAAGVVGRAAALRAARAKSCRPASVIR